MPKGISKSDWDQVTELACDVANASEAGDDKREAAASSKLLQYLSDLEEKYGEHPSIISTIGDFADGFEERMSYYERALALAREQGNTREEQETLDSIRHLKDDFS